MVMKFDRFKPGIGGVVSLSLLRRDVRVMGLRVGIVCPVDWISIWSSLGAAGSLLFAVLSGGLVGLAASLLVS